MASAGTVDVTLRVKGAQQSAAAIASTTKSVKSLRKQALKLTAALGGVGFAMKKLADANGRFEQGLAAVGAVTKATTSEMQALKDAAIQAGIATQFSPVEAVNGLNALATAGQTAGQAIKTLIPVLDLAAGSLGQLGTGEAAMAVVGTLNSYTMSADKATEVTDKLLRITQLTNFQTRDFSAGLAKASAKTAVYGQSLDDTLIAMGLLRNANIDASSASTAYSMAVQRVATDTAALNTLNEMGASLYDEQTGKVRSFLDLVTELKPKLDKLSDATRNKALKDMFGARSIAAYTAIAGASVTVTENGEKVTLKGADAIARLRQNMADAGGTAAGFKKSLLDTFEGQKTLLAGSLETLAVISGEEFANAFRPFVENAIEGINRLIKVIKSMTSEQKKEIVQAALQFMKYAAAIAAAGVAITTILGPMTKLIAFMTTLSGLIKTIAAGNFATTIAGYGGAFSNLIPRLATVVRLMGGIKLAAAGAVAATAVALKTSADRVRQLRKDAEIIEKVRNQTATAAEYERFRVGAPGTGNIEQRIRSGGRFSFATTELNLQNEEISAQETNLAKVQARYKLITGIIQNQLQLQKVGKDGLQQTVIENGRVVAIQKISLQTLVERAKRLRQIASNISDERAKQKYIQDSLARQTESMAEKVSLSGKSAANAEREAKAIQRTIKVMTAGEQGLTRARQGQARRRAQAQENARITRRAVPAAVPRIVSATQAGGADRFSNIMQLGPGATVGGEYARSVAAPTLPTGGTGLALGDVPEVPYFRLVMSEAASAAMKFGAGLATITGKTLNALAPALGGQLPGLLGALGSAVSPALGAIGGMVDMLFGQSEQGKQAKAALQGLATTVSTALKPVFDALVPVIGLLQPLFTALFTAFEPLIQLVASLLFPALKFLGLLLTNIGIALSYFQLALLKVADFFGDYGDEIDKVESRIARQTAARNKLLSTSVEGATAAVARNAEANAQAATQTEAMARGVESVNAVSGYKVARTAYGADAGVANDFISRPGQPLQKFSPADTIVGFNGEGPLGGGGGATYNIGEVIIQGIENPEDFWRKIEEAVNFNVVRGGSALPAGSRFGGL